MRTSNALVVIAALAGSAAAGPSKDAIRHTLSTNNIDDGSAVRFGFDSTGVHTSGTSLHDVDSDLLDLAMPTSLTVATSRDGQAVWIAAHVQRAVQCGGLTGTVAQCENGTPPVEVLLVEELAGKTWRPVAVHSARALSDRLVANRLAAGAKLAELARAVDDTAADPVKLFAASVSDPKALAATVSPRADTVLVGSAGERYTTGAKVRSTLLAWKLAFSVHDGIVAGTTSSKTVAWVAANIDARPAGKPDAKPTPYRALFVYEHEPSAWKLVAAQFSFVAPADPP